MKKSILALLFAIFFVSLILNVSAFSFEKTPIRDVVASELSIPATYNFTIVNTGLDDYFKVYSLVNIKTLPLTPFPVKSLEIYNFIFSALPLERAEQKGKFAYGYYVKGEKAGAMQDLVEIQVLPLRDIINFRVVDIAREDIAMGLNITVPVNIDLGNATISIESDLGKISKTDIMPVKGSKIINVPFTSDIKTIVAGKYPVKVTFYLNNEYNYTVSVNATVTEISTITSSETIKRGFFGFKTTITKKNDGNTIKLVSAELIKNRFERAFTSYNLAPTSEDGNAWSIKQTWEKELKPGESLVVEASTDYTIPIIILILLIISTISLIIVRRPRIIVRKKAIKMTTKGGEFAVKVILFAKNISQEAKEVTMIDQIPGVTQLYEKFGAAKPEKIEGNRLTWKFGTVLPGEEIIVSYVIYSKVRPVGTMVLPETVVHYLNARDKRRYASSNRVLVVSND